MKLFYSLIQIVLFLHSFGMKALAFTNDHDPLVLDSCEKYFEKVTLITDRTLYIAGEDIWFSAFLQCGENSTDACLSQILFIEVYRRSDGSSVRQKLKIEHGMASGSITVPSNFPTGNYYVRAYTNYQKNYLVEDLTCNEILILNPEIPLSTSDSETPIILYFKGGQPIYSLSAEGVMALRNIGKNILDANIITKNNEIISPVSIINKAFGIFKFLPEPGEEYAILIRFDEGDSLLYPIRTISISGWRIVTSWTENLLSINVTGVNVESSKSCKLIVKDRYMRIVKTDVIQLVENKGQYIIPLHRFNTDLNYIIIKNMLGELVAFTVICKPDNERVLIELETDKLEYSPGEKIELTIKGLDDGYHTGANLVISAVVNGSAQFSELHDFHSLYQDIFGIIHENSIRQNRASIEKLISENPGLTVQSLPETRDVSLSGLVVNSNTGKPVGNSRVYLSVLGPEPQLHISETSDDGSFVFSLNNITGQRKVCTEVDYMHQKDTKILIHNDFIREYSPSYTILSLVSDNHNLYDKLYINMQVAKRFGAMNKNYMSVPFISQPIYTHPDISVHLSDYIELSSMKEVFTEIVPYTYLKQRRDSFYFQVKNLVTGEIMNNPLVMLDNVPVFDMNAILELLPASIDRIDVVRQEYFMGSYKCNGIIHIISKVSQLERIEFSGGTVFFDYQTLSPESKFELTEIPEKCNSTGSIPCFSNILYWNPDVVLNQFPVKLEFFTARNESEYQIVVSGITHDGAPCYGERIIHVNNK